MTMHCQLFNGYACTWELFYEVVRCWLGVGWQRRRWTWQHCSHYPASLSQAYSQSTHCTCFSWNNDCTYCKITHCRLKPFKKGNATLWTLIMILIYWKDDTVIIIWERQLSSWCLLVWDRYNVCNIYNILIVR